MNRIFYREITISIFFHCEKKPHRSEYPIKPLLKKVLFSMKGTGLLCGDTTVISDFEMIYALRLIIL